MLVSKLLPFGSFIFIVMLWFSCNDSEMDYNPCLSPKRIAFIKPSFSSINWMPYFGRPNINFKGPSRTLHFIVNELQVLTENPQDSFYIICQENKQQNQIVFYSTGKYSTLLVNSDPNEEIQYFKIEALNILDEPFSDYETIRIADILSISAGLKQTDGSIFNSEILRFTLEKNNYISTLPSANIHSALQLGNRTYSQVFYNVFDIEDMKLYYNQPQGLVGFTYKQVLYYLP